MKAYWKDIFRTIKKEKKRFFSILLITALGVTMFAGLSAGCRDLRASADQFYDARELYDIRIQSTLGLDDDDVKAIAGMDGVEKACGSYSETVLVAADGLQQKADVKRLDEKGLSQPDLLEGELPQKAEEIAVSENYCSDTGKKIGDIVTLTPESDDDTSALVQREYTITAIMLDATDLIAGDGAASFRAAQTAKYFFYVVPDALDTDIYSSVEVQVKGAAELSCFSEEYQQKVSDVKRRIEKEIKEEREQARYHSIVSDAEEELNDARTEADEQFADADAQIADAREELSDGRRELEDGWQQIRSGIEALQTQEKSAETQFLQAYEQIRDGYEQLADGEEQLARAKEELAANRTKLESGKTALTEQRETALAEIESGETQLNDGLLAAKAGEEQLHGEVLNLSEQLGDAWPGDAWDDFSAAAASSDADALASAKESLNTQMAQRTAMLSEQLQRAIDALDPESADYEARRLALAEQKAQLEQIPEGVSLLADQYVSLQQNLSLIQSQKSELKTKKEQVEAQFAEAERELSENELSLLAGEQTILSQEEVLKDSRNKLDESLRLLKNQEASAKQQIAEAKAQLEEGKQELLEAEQKLSDGEAELADQVETLNEEREKAYDELEDAQKEIDDIEPATWYVQDRSSVSSYSTIKSDAASIETIGNVFPVLFLSVAILISLTTITRLVEEERGQIGIYKALGFSGRHVYGKYLIYTLLACLCGGLIGDIGGFILLPRFLFMVFRVMYKIPSYVYLFDLVYGISGILLFVVGVLAAAVFACRNELQHCPAALMRPKAPKAGSRVFLERIPFVWRRLSFLNKVTIRNLFRYKKRMIMTVSGILGCTALLVVGMAIKNSVTDLLPKQYDHISRYDLMAVVSADDMQEFTTQVDADSMIASYQEMLIDSVQAKTVDETSEETVSLYVVEAGSDLEDYIYLEGTDSAHAVLKDGEVLITENLSDVLQFTEGDSFVIQDSDLSECRAEISGIVHNYLGNAIYMTQQTYEELFEKDYEANAILAHLPEDCSDPVAYADELATNSDVLSCSSVQAMRNEFSKSFGLINSVVLLVTVLAAGLAFVVLFTLATTNISERERELATIKVLGFFDSEVHLYVNKETLILTVIGILLGLPVGRFFAGLLTSVLKMPSIYFAVSVHPSTYLFAGGMTFLFALTVNLITNRLLNSIDMVDALKSVE